MRASLASCYGVDLRELGRGERTPDEVWDLLVHLPRDSALMSALADDDEFASADSRPQPPRMSEFGPQVEALAQIHDLLATLVSIVGSLGGSKVQIPPYPRPVTASDRARKLEARRAHQDLVRRLIPPKGS